jgi:uncharacterized membrane protein
MQVMALYITGGLNAIFSPAHQKEIIRYLYNHQVLFFSFLFLFLKQVCAFRVLENQKVG